MKSPAEYVAAILPERGHGSQALVFAADAEWAVAQALADAERYKDLLLKALRARPAAALDSFSKQPKP